MIIITLNTQTLESYRECPERKTSIPRTCPNSELKRRIIIKKKKNFNFLRLLFHQKYSPVHRESVDGCYCSLNNNKREKRARREKQFDAMHVHAGDFNAYRQNHKRDRLGGPVMPDEDWTPRVYAQRHACNYYTLLPRYYRGNYIT